MERRTVEPDHVSWPDHATWVREALARYEGPLVRYATSITRDAERARDVVQETFLRLCRERPEELDGHLARWLYTVCRNRALDVTRKERRMSTMSDSALEARTDTDQDPAQAAERQEAVGRVMAVLSSIPASQQEVIRLRFQSGLSYKEIAGVTGHTVGNVGYLMHTALKSIRGQLA